MGQQNQYANDAGVHEMMGQFDGMMSSTPRNEMNMERVEEDNEEDVAGQEESHMQQ